MAAQPPIARGRTGQRRPIRGCVRFVTTLRPGNRRQTIRCPVRSDTRPVVDTTVSTTTAQPSWRYRCGPLPHRSPGKGPRLPHHPTREPWSLCRGPAWPDLDRGGCYGREAQQETQAAEKEAQAAWRAVRRPGARRRTVPIAGCNLRSRPIPTLLRWSAMRSDDHERHCRHFLLRAGGDFMYLWRILLLRHLRLSRWRRHVRPLPGSFL